MDMEVIFFNILFSGELTKDLEKDESILSISLDLMINSKVVLKHEFGQKLSKLYNSSVELQKNIAQVQKDEVDGSIINNADNFGFPMIALYLFLIHERRNRDSFWKYYWPVLPTSYTTALYFDDQDLELLKGTNLYCMCIYVETSEYYWDQEESCFIVSCSLSIVDKT